MGFGSIWHWLIVLVIVLVIFGTKKLRNLGSDVGGAIRNFKEAMNEGQQGQPAENPPASQTTIDVKPVQTVDTPKEPASVLNKENQK